MDMLFWNADCPACGSSKLDTFSFGVTTPTSTNRAVYYYFSNDRSFLVHMDEKTILSGKRGPSVRGAKHLSTSDGGLLLGILLRNACASPLLGSEARLGCRREV